MRARAASWACWALTVPGNWTGQRLVQHLHKAAVWEAANTTGPRDTPGHCCCVWGLRTVIGIQALTDVTANDLALKPWSGPSMRLLAAACCPSSPELHSCLQTPAHTLSPSLRSWSPNPMVTSQPHASWIMWGIQCALLTRRPGLLPLRS